jgi:hypothetical protein
METFITTLLLSSLLSVVAGLVLALSQVAASL